MTKKTLRRKAAAVLEKPAENIIEFQRELKIILIAKYRKIHKY